MAISTSLWDNSNRKYLVEKIALVSGYRLVVLILAGWILSMWK